MSDSELTCPVCAGELVSKKQLGVVVYACEQHGIWLFNGLLEQMLWAFSRTDRVRGEAIARELDKEKERRSLGLSDFLPGE